MPTAIDRFEAALRDHAEEFDVQLDADTSTELRTYYKVLLKWNARLHLVAPCSPEEFATRHVLESLLLMRYVKPNAAVVDIGSGGGLPMLPLLIARRDIHGTLIESSQRKSIFLREALRAVSRDANVLNERFENLTPPVADYVTCRALERLTQKLPAMLTLARPNSTLLLFGGQSLTEELQKLGCKFERVQIPRSLRRYLLIVPPR